LKMCVRYTVLVQKGNKDIIKVVHVTSVGKLECFEALKIHFGLKITKTTTLFKFCCQTIPLTNNCIGSLVIASCS